MIKRSRSFTSALGVLVLGYGLLSGPAAEHEAVTPAAREGGPHERFLRLNQRVQERQGQVDLVFVGDSITQGWEGAGRKVWERYYGHRRALNLGIGGDRTQHLLWRFDHGNLDGIEPKAVVLMIGTNNSGGGRNTPEEIVDGVKAVVVRLREKLPGARILLLGIFPRGERFNDQRGRILQVNQALRKIADGAQVRYLDFGHELISEDGSIPKEIMPDSLHLSEKGYAIWAAAVEPVVAEWLGDTPVSALDPGGKWTWTIRGPNGEMMEAPLELKLEGNKVSGVFHTQGGRNLQIEEGVLEGDTLRLRVPRDRPQGGEMIYRMTGRVTGDRIEGSVEVELDGQVRLEPWRAWRSKE